jgi:hypothetical protein
VSHGCVTSREIHVGKTSCGVCQWRLFASRFCSIKFSAKKNAEGGACWALSQVSALPGHSGALGRTRGYIMRGSHVVAQRRLDADNYHMISCDNRDICRGRKKSSSSFAPFALRLRLRPRRAGKLRRREGPRRRYFRRPDLSFTKTI